MIPDYCELHVQQKIVKIKMESFYFVHLIFYVLRMSKTFLSYSVMVTDVFLFLFDHYIYTGMATVYCLQRMLTPPRHLIISLSLRAPWCYANEMYFAKWIFEVADSLLPSFSAEKNHICLISWDSCLASNMNNVQTIFSTF